MGSDLETKTDLLRNIDLLTYKMDVTDFIDEHIESMLLRPLMWGGNFTVEVLVLFALATRVKVRSGEDPKRIVYDAFNEFIKKSLENSTAAPFSSQLETLGISNEFSARMRTFVNQFIFEFRDYPHNTGKYHSPQKE